jgi:TonB family protein
MNRWISRVITVGTLLSVLPSAGQNTVQGDGAPSPSAQSSVKRKLVFRVEPVYNQELQRHYIGGVVRLKIVVSPRGTVETISPMGGNPVLVESAVKAVKSWKYAPADSATEMQLNINFDPHRE